MTNSRRHPSSSHSEGEIKLLDFLRLLSSHSKAIVTGGILGIAVCLIYLTLAPKKYEALAQIQMAQTSPITNQKLNLPGSAIESALVLVNRLSVPTSYSSDVLRTCSLESESNSGEILVARVKASVIKGIVDAVELKIVGDDPKAASICALSIYEMIVSTQKTMIAPYLKQAMSLLHEDQAKLMSAKNTLSKASESNDLDFSNKIAVRDEIRYLLDEIFSLKNIIFDLQSGQTRLISPIYVNPTPISPKKRLAFFGCMLLGMLIGFAVSWVSKRLV